VGKRWWGRKEQNNKTPKIFPTYWISACGGFEWGARKRFKKKMKGKILGVLYPDIHRGRRWGVRGSIGIGIFFEKSSKVGQQGEPDRI